MEQVAANRIFGGQQLRYRHSSKVLNCDMHFSLFLPPSAEQKAEQNKVPVLYWLSGLTCTDENFVTKAGAQKYAAEHGLAIVCPDTSPRGDGIPDDPEGAWDFGSGAGFYVNATQAPWAEHYQMYDYIVHELPELLSVNDRLDTDRCSLSGHSMGGHGALTIGLKNPARYQSVSAFAPIASPVNCAWGKKAFANYLGEDQQRWLEYDTCALLSQAQASDARQLPMLVDQGSDDAFLPDQLNTELLIKAAADYPMTVRYQTGYDHSYFFIATFIEEHIAFHARHLNAGKD